MLRKGRESVVAHALPVVCGHDHGATDTSEAGQPQRGIDAIDALNPSLQGSLMRESISTGENPQPAAATDALCPTGAPHRKSRLISGLKQRHSTINGDRNLSGKEGHRVRHLDTVADLRVRCSTWNISALQYRVLVDNPASPSESARRPVDALAWSPGPIPSTTTLRFLSSAREAAGGQLQPRGRNSPSELV